MRHSIRIKLTMMFAGVLAFLVLAYMLLNMFFLKDYYMGSKEKILLDTYEQMNRVLELSTEEELSDGIRNSLYKTCEDSGVSVLLVDDRGKVRVCLGNEKLLIYRLQNVYFPVNQNDNTRIIKENDYYVLQEYEDQMFEDSRYLEMYGFTDQGQRFIMRMGIESIEESISIFNKFFLLISGLILVFGMVGVFFIARGFTKPIMELSHISKEMTSLNFNVSYQGKRKDEIGILGENMNELSEKLKSTITELKNANATLQQDIQNKIEIDEMRKEFVSNVSHELKTPLTVIQGYAEGLKDCVNDDEESREYYVDVIVDEANKMNAMVKQLLSLNRLEFGTQEIEMEQFSLDEMLEGMLHKFEQIFETKGITCELQLPDRIPKVWADEFQMEEVLSNYLSNAVNHCSGKKRIIVSVTEGNSSVRVNVFNTGELIPEMELEKLWTKFYKVDKARSREYGGSGIGLSIVKAIMERHGQNYGVQNEETGVSFWFEIDTKLS